MTSSKQIEFVTLGMFILDDIYPRKTDPDQEPKINVIGGAGTYSAIGARLFCPPPSSRTVGWIVDAGTDFPQHVYDTIRSWDTAVLLRQRDALTTRGWNAYTQDEHRAFRYLTEKKRITAEDLSDTLVQSKSVHMICSAERCQTLVQEILDRRKEFAINRPLFIWEPVPDLCTAAELESIKAALHEVDIISPNHEELATIFESAHTAGTINRSLIENQAKQMLSYGIGPGGNGAVVVRSSKEGVFAISKAAKFWVPAYHSDQHRVIDPTGGGNGFLGGFAIGLAKEEPLEMAVLMGTVAASFCIEQVGPPRLHEGSIEHWNGEVVQHRITELQARIAHA